MYYLYAERYENILNKSLMENIFVVFKDLYKGVFVPFAQLSTKVQSFRDVFIKKISLSYGQTSKNNIGGEEGWHCHTLAGMARVKTPVFCPYVTAFCPLYHLFLNISNHDNCHTGVAAPESDRSFFIANGQDHR